MAALTPNQIQHVYIAFFGRPADASGYNDALKVSTDEIKGLYASFPASDEFKGLYPDDLTDRQFIQQVYKNLFRDADLEGGDAFWYSILI
jgi:hypothetical protein